VPMTSAVKVEGERLYRRAHRGERVETPRRTIEVHRAELLGSDDEHAEFEIECSSGTYIRALIEELGDAYCERLRRTAIGPFRIEDASDEALGAERALAFLPERPLSQEEVERVAHGAAVSAGEEIGEGPIRMMDGARLVAVGRRREDLLRPEVVLR